jgi:predicted transcriptional regulator of viral defense system
MPTERRFCLPTDDKLVEHAIDAELARLAGRQHGVVATRQLSALGLARGGVAARARAGRLHRVHRGVYAVGHTVLTVNGRRMAAVPPPGLARC